MTGVLPLAMLDELRRAAELQPYWWATPTASASGQNYWTMWTDSGGSNIQQNPVLCTLDFSEICSARRCVVSLERQKASSLQAHLPARRDACMVSRFQKPCVAQGSIFDAYLPSSRAPRTCNPSRIMCGSEAQGFLSVFCQLRRHSRRSFPSQ